MTESPRKRGPRGDVTVDLIVEAAESVLCDGGMTALSLRSVARAAGVSPNAIYTYVADMAALRNHLGEAFLGRLELPLLTSGTPAEGLHNFLTHVLDNLQGSPHQAALLASQRIMGPHALALNEALLDFCVDRAGLTMRQASAATQMLTEWVHGRVQVEASDSISDSFRTALKQVDFARYPRTQQMLTMSVDDLVLDLVVGAVTRTTDDA